MSSLINIYLPPRPSPVTDNTAIFAAANAINIGKHYVEDKAIGFIRDETRKLQEKLSGKLSGEFNFFEHRLRTDGGLVDNNVILRVDVKTKIEFIDAIVDITKENGSSNGNNGGNKGNNNITETATPFGTVKERFSQDDYTVKITASLISERYKFPYQELRILNEILNSAKSIEIASAYCNIFGINKLAFTKATFFQSGNQSKHFNVQPVILEFKSDRDYDFLVKEE